LQVARQQAEAILEAARKQAKALSAPLTDIAASMTKTAEEAVPAAESVAEPVADAASEVAQEVAAETEAVVEAAADAVPAKKTKAAKKADTYDGWTKPQLQEELVNRGLPKSGNVPELRERLLAND
jgi:hypothetical protein